MVFNFRIQISVALLLVSIPVVLLAQQKIPTYSGDGEVAELVDGDVGVIFDIGSGLTMKFPKGVNDTGVYTFKKTRERPGSSQVHPDFNRHGPTLYFDGVLRTSAEPIVVCFGLSREPRREGLKFVLAMEVEGPCEGRYAKYELETGMCSHWVIADTEYDDTNKCMAAELTQTGGFRLQFGWMPQ